MKLRTEPNLAAPDEIYAALLHLHEGRTLEDGARLNFRLILLLANHIGDEATIREAFALAAERGP